MRTLAWRGRRDYINLGLGVHLCGQCDGPVVTTQEIVRSAVVWRWWFVCVRGCDVAWQGVRDGVGVVVAVAVVCFLILPLP